MDGDWAAFNIGGEMVPPKLPTDRAEERIQQERCCCKVGWSWGGLQLFWLLSGLIPGSPVGSKAAVCLWAISLAPAKKGHIQKVRLHDGL